MSETGAGSPSWWKEAWEGSSGPTLSIIVPVYNERYLVAELLGRLLATEIEGVGGTEIVLVDDGSTDGTAEIVDRIAAENPDRIHLLRHPENRGKGAAVRTAIEAAQGDLIVFQDADLEYDPADLSLLVRPFLQDGADVVYGSRYLASERRRVLAYRHSQVNRFLTFLSNLTTDLALTDVETCYKMFRGPLLKSVPLRSPDFRMELELSAKVAKRNCRIFEVPISYRGRTHQEGKKIGVKDGVLGLGAILHWWLVDDVYAEDEYGSAVVRSQERTRRFHGWLAAAVKPWVGDRVLEVGAGIAATSALLVPRDRYLATDDNPSYLHYLRNFSVGKPYLEVEHFDPREPVPQEWRQGFDTVLTLNLLEHVEDPVACLRHLGEALEPAGRLVFYVPRGPGLMSSLDESAGHLRRYDRETLRRQLTEAGFELEECQGFNRTATLGWWLNGRVLKRQRISRWQLKIFDVMVPILKRLDRFLPGRGLGLLGVARRRD